MPALVIIGEDLRQLTSLAAGLQRYFRQITIIHAEDALARAKQGPVDVRRTTLVCLSPGSDGSALISLIPNLSFVIEAGPQRNALTAAGAQCFDPEAEPHRIARAISPSLRVQSSRPSRLAWPSWPAARPTRSGAGAAERTR